MGTGIQIVDVDAEDGILTTLDGARYVVIAADRAALGNRAPQQRLARSIDELFNLDLGTSVRFVALDRGGLAAD